jgi:hypothetical protein
MPGFVLRIEKLQVDKASGVGYDEQNLSTS